MGSQRVRYGLAAEQQQQENKWKREDGKVVVAVRPSQAKACGGGGGGRGEHRAGQGRAKAAVLLLFRTSHWEGYVTARRGLCGALPSLPSRGRTAVDRRPTGQWKSCPEKHPTPAPTRKVSTAPGAGPPWELYQGPPDPPNVRGMSELKRFWKVICTELLIW